MQLDILDTDAHRVTIPPEELRIVGVAVNELIPPEVPATLTVTGAAFTVLDPTADSSNL